MEEVLSPQRKEHHEIKCIAKRQEYIIIAKNVIIHPYFFLLIKTLKMYGVNKIAATVIITNGIFYYESRISWIYISQGINQWKS
ncbi:MAG: hypothetical protein MZV64_21695 [Ignavibacteriales bacterium]|nr:hypothetical protein [Ignavibacteriales bacterium]